jgi:hypothetical protein
MLRSSIATIQAPQTGVDGDGMRMSEISLCREVESKRLQKNLQGLALSIFYDNTQFRKRSKCGVLQPKLE